KYNKPNRFESIGFCFYYKLNPLHLLFYLIEINDVDTS
ncbi:MAG: hypothetical protein RLZZ44_754, partial [Bacteroidota bacterium]